MVVLTFALGAGHVLEATHIPALKANVITLKEGHLGAGVLDLLLFSMHSDDGHQCALLVVCVLCGAGRCSQAKGALTKQTVGPQIDGQITPSLRGGHNLRSAHRRVNALRRRSSQASRK